MDTNKDIFSLKNKVVVITGATGLLGTQHVEAVASKGGIPILIDLDLQIIQKCVKKVKDEFGVICNGFKVDITNEEQIKACALEVFKLYGKIDGLINNAANNPKVEEKTHNFSRLENFDLKHWNADIEVSLTGSFLCSKHFGYLISKNPDGGSIINISSDLGLIAPNQNLYKKSGLKEEQQSVKPVTYSVVKHGIIGLTKYLSTYWPDKNVRCNAICPGGIENGQDIEFQNKVSKLIPLGRMAKKDEIKGLIIYLISDASTYMNGAIISIDGGRTTW
jgi:NAD(P)-dependent dehydrogenase (short-subunit alcohol dehydrogenase family)